MARETLLTAVNIPTLQGPPEQWGLYLNGYSAYPVLSLLPVWGEKAALIFL